MPLGVNVILILFYVFFPFKNQEFVSNILCYSNVCLINSSLLSKYWFTYVR